MSYPAAGGYPQYGGGPLIPPIITQRMTEIVGCKLNVLDFTTGEYLGELKECGDSVTLMTPPRARPRPMVKNQKLEPHYMSIGKKHLQVGKMMYDMVKIDKADEDRACNFPQVLDKYLTDVANQFMAYIQMDVLATGILGVDPANQGACAGCVSRCFNMGTLGNPLCFDYAPENATKPLLWINDMESVLMESCSYSPGYGYEITPGGDADLFMVIPILLYNLLKVTLSSGPCCLSADSTPLVNGMLPQKIGPFTVFVSAHVPTYKENGGDVYQIIAGRRDAIAFVHLFEESDQVQEACHRGHFYRSFVGWGTAVVEPKYLVKSLVKINKV